MDAVVVSIGILIKTFSKDHVEIYLQKREEEGDLNGKWEFPGGKVEPGETPLEAVIREFSEETWLDIEDLHIKHFQTIPYTYPDRKLILCFYLINGFNISAEFERIDFDNYHQFLHKIPSANHEIMENLKTYLESENSRYLWK